MYSRYNRVHLRKCQLNGHGFIRHTSFRRATLFCVAVAACFLCVRYAASNCAGDTDCGRVETTSDLAERCSTADYLYAMRRTRDGVRYRCPDLFSGDVTVNRTLYEPLTEAIKNRKVSYRLEEGRGRVRGYAYVGRTLLIGRRVELEIKVVVR